MTAGASAAKNGSSVLVFLIAGERHAVSATAVLEIVRAVAVTPLPGAPRVIIGVVDRRGDVVPVMDLRRRFGHEPSGPRIDEHLIFVTSGTRRLALKVDAALEIIALTAGELVAAQTFVTRSGTVAGVARLADGLVLVHDLVAFLDQAESAELDAALEARGSARGAGGAA